MNYSFKTTVLVLISVLFLALSVVSCNSGGQGKTKSKNENKKPNIIFIMADDMATQAISAYGGIYKDIAPTPHMDKLADQGMIFHDMLCTNAICGPSRYGILTGDQSTLNGYYKNERGGIFDASKWTFPQEFQKNGYQTSLFGKWHLGSEPKGFDVYKYHVLAGQQGEYWNPVYNENGKDVKEKGYATNLSAGFAIDWLENGRKKDAPFLMLLQFKAPHRSWQPDKKYEKLWEDIEMPYPSTFNDDYKGREKTAGDTEMTMDYFSRKDMKYETPKGLKGKERILWNFYGTRPGQIVQPEGMSAEEGRKWRYQNYIKDYLACVKSVDDNIGRVVKYLEDNGLADNTIIMITSDQGFYLGEHGFFDKRFIYEPSVKMPLIIRYPGHIKPGSVNKDIVTNIDFAPTLLDLAGIKTDHKMQGSNFAPLLSGKTPGNWQKAMYYHYYEFPYWHHVQPHYGIRTDRYTLAHFYYNVDVWELYDNQKDPEQIHNLIDDPAYAEVVKDLKAQLKQLMIKFDDNKSLEEFRAITDKNFGNIVKTKKGEQTVQDILTEKPKEQQK
jgi:arylsulfatase A-like enzyme